MDICLHALSVYVSMNTRPWPCGSSIPRLLKIWPVVLYCQYQSGGETLWLWLTGSRNKSNTCYVRRERTVAVCVFVGFSHAVQCLTNKWSETKNRALSEGKAPMGIRTTAVLGCIWSTKLMNATKRDRGVTRLLFFVFFLCRAPLGAVESIKLPH